MRSCTTMAIWLVVTMIPSALAQETLSVLPATVSDQKAVFATVESKRVVPARARIGGTIAELGVKEGDSVGLGQALATVGDEKLVLQMDSLDAQIAGLEAQLSQAQTDLARAEELFDKGTVPRTRLDEARTAFNVANNALRSRKSQRAVIEQQLAEGEVLAPASGRVLKVPYTVGTVVRAGESVADIAERDFILRLRVPERHARFLKAGDTVRVDAAESDTPEPRFGKVELVYPQIEDGRVVADAAVEGLGDYFVGQRIRVWVSAGERKAFVIPESFIDTRFGVDYVTIRTGGDETRKVPVQRGRALPRPDMPNGIEILSGVNAGDRLVKP